MARETSRSKELQARSPRSVTFTPMACPSRSLKPAIDCFALVTTVFWPVISSRSRWRLDEGLLLGGPADAAVEHDLLETRDLHDVGQAELLLELGRSTFK